MDRYSEGLETWGLLLASHWADVDKQPDLGPGESEDVNKRGSFIDGREGGLGLGLSVTLYPFNRRGAGGVSRGCDSPRSSFLSIRAWTGSQVLGPHSHVPGRRFKT